MKEITKENLFARVIKSIDGLHQDSAEVIITFTDGSTIVQKHHQDCCESVTVEQVDGEPSKHIGATIYALNEKVLDKDEMNPSDLPEYYDSLTATFYTMQTSKGYLDWRWYGESNGYYSESIDCILNNKE